jgi:CBS domain-containing protein
MKVSDILQSKNRNPQTVTPNTLLSECVILMADEDLGSLVVMDRQQLVGLLTFREVILILAQRQKELRSGPTPPVADLKVGDVMNPSPIFVGLNVEVNDLRARMINLHQRYIPVLDKGNLIGILSFHDVARAIHVEQDLENRQLKSYIGDWPLYRTSP